MEKDFFDVFPSLKVKKELEELLDMVFVTRVSCNPSRTHIWVYIKSERWIHKKHIFELEEQIERQIFAGLNVTITVPPFRSVQSSELSGNLQIQHGTGTAQLQYAGIQYVQTGADFFSRRK